MRLLLIVAICSLPVILFAQTGTISGHVVDEKSGIPLPLANILVSPGRTGATTDTTGHFEIMLPLGSYTLEFRFIGYKSETHVFSLNPESPAKQLIVKLQESLIKGQGVTVWGKYEAVSGVQAIEHKDIRRMPTVYSDVLRSIKILPGVTSNNELSSAFNVRGGNYDENLIYLNGYEIFRPALLRQGVEENQSLINPDLVRDIRLYGGVFPARFGDKLSSALEVTYGLNHDDSSKITVRADFLNTGIGVQKQYKKLNVAFGIRYANPSVFVSKLQTTGDYTPEFLDIQALVNYQINPTASLEIFVLNAQNKFDLTPETWHGHFGGLMPREVRIDWNGERSYNLTTQLLAVKLKKQLGQNLHYNLSVSNFITEEDEGANITGDFFYARNARFPDEDSYVKTRFETADNFLNVQSTEIQNELNFQLNRHLLKIGAQYRFMNQENAQDEFVQETSEQSAIETEQVIQTSLEADFDSFNAFVQDNFVLSEKLRTNVGVRFLHHTFTEENLFSPRAGIEFDANPDNLFSAGVGVYYQPPFFHELRGKQNAEQIDLKSQRSIQTNVGWKHRVHEKMNWQLDLYYKKLDKLIPYNQEELRLIYGDENNYEGFAYGLDFLFMGEIVPGVNSWMSYSYLKSREREIGTDDYKRRLLDQTHTFRFFLQDKVPKFPNMQAHMRFLYGSGFLYYPLVLQDDGDGGQQLVVDFETLEKFRYYLRVDLGFTYDINFSNNRSLIFTAEVLNAWNVVNTADYEYVQFFAGRSPFRIPKVLSKRFINFGFELTL